MRIKELKQSKADLIAEAKGIFDLAATEGRGLTDAEKERDDVIAATLETVAQDTSREERQLERERELAVSAPPSVNGGVTSPRNEADPMRGFARPRDYALAVMAAGRGQRVDERLLGLRAAVGSDEQGTCWRHRGHADES